MISSSSRISRTMRKMLNPLARATAPRITKTKNAQVPQKTTISFAERRQGPGPEHADGVGHAAERADRRRPHDQADHAEDRPSTRPRRRSGSACAGRRRASRSPLRRGSPARGCAGSRSRRTGDEARGQQVVGDEADQARARCRPPRRSTSAPPRARRRSARRRSPSRGRRRSRRSGRAPARRRHREEVGERAQREPAGAREVAQRRDADDDRDEDHRSGDRLDQLDERLREPFRLRRRSPGTAIPTTMPRAIAMITQNHSCLTTPRACMATLVPAH